MMQSVYLGSYAPNISAKINNRENDGVGMGKSGGSHQQLPPQLGLPQVITQAESA